MRRLVMKKCILCLVSFGLCFVPSVHAQLTNVGSVPEVLYPTLNVVYPPNTNISAVVELPSVEYQACGLWTFEIEVLGESDSQPRRFVAAAQWTPQAKTIETGAATISESGCLGIKRFQLPEGSYAIRTSAKDVNGKTKGLTGWTPFSVRGEIAAQRQRVSPTMPAPEREPMRTGPDRQDLEITPQSGAAQLEGEEHAMMVRPTGGNTTVKVRDPGKTGDWGTEATIHYHQDVSFLWNTGVSGVASAEWQVWSQDPRGRSVPVSAKLATGALEVTGAMSLFPIHFGTFVPELPPELPAEQKYWVTVSTKDARGTEAGSPPTPVTVAFRACSDNQQCPEEYFCDPDKRVCEEVEAFCASAWEIPGYKGTGYSKGDSGYHIQGTDGSVVRCVPYRCEALPDGTPQCLSSCDSTADCQRGYACESKGSCVRW